MWRELIEVLISGVSLGSVYSIMAVGMALVYGVSKIFNFAYGSFFMWGAYVAWLLFTLLASMNYPIALIIVILIMFLFGLIIERGIIRPLRWRANWGVTTMMVTLGLAIFLDNAALISFGPHTKSLPLLFKGAINLGGIFISTQDIAMLLFAILVMSILMLFLGKTEQGMSIRAVAQDPVGAQIVGIPVDRVFSYTFAISTVLVGIGGILLAPKYFISPLGGWGILVKAFVIVAFGGLGSIKGTLYAAFILGVVEALVAWQIGATWVMVFWFSVLLGTLTVRPRGLFGTWE